MPNSPLTNTRIPDTTHNANIADIVHDAIYDLEADTCPAFTSTAARDSAFSAWTAATGQPIRAGRMCFTDDAGYWTRENGVWRSFTGLIGHGISTTSQTYVSGTATRLINGLPFSAYLRVGRAYRYTAELRGYSTVAGDVAAVAARLTFGTGSTAVTDPQITGSTASCETATSAHQYPLYMRKTFQVSATGSYQFNVWGNRAIGSGTITFNGMSDAALTQQVEDAGVALPTVPVPST